MNVHPQIPDLFSANYPLERQIRAWMNVSDAQQRSELFRVCGFLFLNPRSSSREISQSIGMERTSVCRVLATKQNKKYFDPSAEKECHFKDKTTRVTAYSLTPEGIEFLENQARPKGN